MSGRERRLAAVWHPMHMQSYYGTSLNLGGLTELEKAIFVKVDLVIYIL